MQRKDKTLSEIKSLFYNFVLKCFSIIFILKYLCIELITLLNNKTDTTVTSAIVVSAQMFSIPELIYR